MGGLACGALSGGLLVLVEFHFLFNFLEFCIELTTFDMSVQMYSIKTPTDLSISFVLLNKAKYGDKVLVLESHIKCGGSAHTFSRMHKGEKYSFEVGPSIFEGLDRPSLNPLRMIFDILEEEMPVKTYTGLGYWTPTGYWRFPIGSKSKFEELLMEQAEDGPKAVKVRMGQRLVDKWCYLRSLFRCEFSPLFSGLYF
jgi:hypothetical protein